MAVAILHNIWNDRKKIRYKGNRSQLPIRNLLSLVVVHIKALMAVCKSVKKRHMWEKELKVLQMAANPPGFVNQAYELNRE